MNRIIDLVPDNIWYALYNAILHSFWQGFVVLALSFIFLRSIRLSKPETRYWIAVVGEFTLLLSFIISFMNALQTAAVSPQIYSIADAQIFANQTMATSDLTSISTVLGYLSNPYFITYVWLTGFILFSARLLVSYGYLIFVHRNAVQENDGLLTNILQITSGRMGLTQTVQIKISKIADTVFNYGFYNPIIIWPASLLNKLSPQEIELILAHELAHIKRKDYLIKMILNVANIILYYHPVMWWLNKVINNEREHACDLAAVSYNGNNKVLATTLLKLQEQKLFIANNASNHFNDKNSFSNRIKRLFNMPIKQSFSKGKLTILMLFIAIGLFAFEYKKEATIDNSLEKIMPLIPSFSMPQVTPDLDTITPGTESRSSAVIIKKDNDKSIKLQIENGVIKELEVDGKVIDKEDYDQYADEIPQINEGQKYMWKDGDDGDFQFGFNMHDMEKMGDLFKNFKMDLGDTSFTKHFGFGFPGDMGMQFDTKDWGNFADSAFSMQFNGKNFNMDEFLDNHREMMERNQERMKSHEDRIQERQEKMKERNGNRHEYDGNAWEKAAKDMERNQRNLERNQKEWEEAAKGFGANDRFFDENNGINLEQKLGSQLNKDGFLLPEKSNVVKLTGKYLRINGEKMPEVIFEKYKRLYEEETGIPLGEKNVIEFKMEGKASNGRKYRAF